MSAPVSVNPRMTRQKAAIFRILESSGTHPTADWIYEQVRRKIPHISLGTVYRNLRTLADTGEIRELRYGTEQSRFEIASEPHAHFYCRICDEIFDVELQPSFCVEQMVAPETPHIILGQQTVFFGYCPGCDPAIGP